jgi:plastocyanin
MQRCAVYLMIFGWQIFCPILAARGQGVDVSAAIAIHAAQSSRDPSKEKTSDGSGVVVWLSPLQKVLEPRPAASAHPPYRLMQKDKQFIPHLLIVPTGTSVEFPNADPFFHNVFSLFNGKRFDLGLYESGSSRSVRFDREGVSYIFCNIHPEMGAVVLALSTPFYAVSGPNGAIVIHGVPSGSYSLNVWSERAKPLEPEGLPREIQISSTATNLGIIQMKATVSARGNHKNKFGEAYRDMPGKPY